MLLVNMISTPPPQIAPMEWTCTPPSEPGWYWLREPGREATVIRAVRDPAGQLVIVRWSDTPETSSEVEWSGPIEMPE